MSDYEAELKKKISDLVREYGNEQMGIRPETVSVDIHRHSINVTLEGVSHPAEMNMAKEKLSREMIERMYSELFNVSKSALQSRIEKLLRKSIDRSFFAVETQFGNAVIVFFFSGKLQYPKLIRALDNNEKS
jgi:uncharacterized protein YbcI